MQTALYWGSRLLLILCTGFFVFSLFKNFYLTPTQVAFATLLHSVELSAPLALLGVIATRDRQNPTIELIHALILLLSVFAFAPLFVTILDIVAPICPAPLCVLLLFIFILATAPFTLPAFGLLFVASLALVPVEVVLKSVSKGGTSRAWVRQVLGWGPGVLVILWVIILIHPWIKPMSLPLL